MFEINEKQLWGKYNKYPFRERPLKAPTVFAN